MIVDRPAATPLALRVASNADAAQIAEAMAAIWQELEDALAPVIGHRGVAALYKRCLYLGGIAHPWMSAPPRGISSDPDPGALKALLARQSAVDAAAGGSAFLDAFWALLAGLVGPSLTERLLGSVWAHSSRGPPAQDTST